MTEWQRHPDEERFVIEMIERISSREPAVGRFLSGVTSVTRTRALDWTDHLKIPWEETEGMELEHSGKEHEQGEAMFFEGTNLPAIIAGKGWGVAISVEDLDLFMSMNGFGTEVHGERHSPFRYSHVIRGEGADLFAVERRGYDGFIVEEVDVGDYLEFRKGMVTRERNRDNEDIKDLARSVEGAVKRIGEARAADAFFWVERRNWESRNLLALMQLEKQNRFGLGWGNHDHHTFRCSRENYRDTISVLETLGLEPRERFYAGDQAGWGAQVMEGSGIVVFADVDLSPEEKEGDFAHEGLEAAEKLGTVGMWVKIHGESINGAGLHHVAVMCDFSRVVSEGGIPTMEPFSFFPFLKQCFTRGEKWKVLKERALELSAQNLISDEQLQRFTGPGALGSHLEFIERREGFKGFNQSSVDDIIKRTDPRKE